MQRMKNSGWVYCSGCRDCALRKNLTSEDSAMGHPLRWSNEDIFLGSSPTGIFDVQSQ
jgi:hypothetical protein